MNKAILLSEVAAVLEAKLLGKTDELSTKKYKDVTTDSREDLAGKIFIAIIGEKQDGHRYLSQAIEKGAVALVVSNHASLEGLSLNLPVFLVQDTRQALWQLAKFYRKSCDTSVIAIAGSVGKTSNKDTISAILSAHARVHKTKENLNNLFGVPYSVLAMPSESELAVLEFGAGSEFGEIETMSKIAIPDITVLTNIGTSHLEHFKTRENIAQEKCGITIGQKPGGPLLINAEDPYLLDFAKRNVNSRPIYLIEMEGLLTKLRTVLEKDTLQTVPNSTDIAQVSQRLEQYQGLYLWDGFVSGTRFSAVNIQSKEDGLQFDFQIKTPSDTVLLERHIEVDNASITFVANLLFALAISQILQYDIDRSIAAIETIEITDGRQSITRFSNNILIDDAYNASPDSMLAAIYFTAEVAKREDINQTLAIIAGVNELGDQAEALHRKMGSYLAKYKFTSYYLIGEWAEVMREGLMEAYPEADVKTFADRHEVEAYLKPQSFTKTLILLKASRGYELDKLSKWIKENKG